MLRAATPTELCQLHAVAAPETGATLEEATSVRERVENIRELRVSEDLDSARETLRALMETLRATPGVEHSHRVANSRGLTWPTRCWRWGIAAVPARWRSRCMAE